VRPSFVAALAAVGATFIAAGCGKEDGTRTHAVEGKVVLKHGDVRALAGGQVMFESVGETRVTGAGEIQNDGSFEAACYLDGKDRTGLPAGEYRVCIRPPAAGGEAPKKSALHPRFRSYDKSGLKVTVAPGTNTPTIEVEAGR
jgi:hypothetical protein